MTPSEPPDRSGRLRRVEGPKASDGGEGGTVDAGLALDLLRGLADQEIVRADSARARARQAFALAAGFFAVVQTVAFGSFVTKHLTRHHAVSSLVNHATVAAIILGACGLMVVIADSAFRSHNVTPRFLKDAIDGSVAEVVDRYYLLVEALRSTNRRRMIVTMVTQVLAFGSIVTSAVELINALHTSL